LVRAVDSAGQTADFYLSETRDGDAAKIFLKRALVVNADHPPFDVFARDGLRGYPSPIRDLKEKGYLHRGYRQRTPRYL
jgi:transposase-like protein